MTDYMLITCEHGGNRVPPRYRHLFHGLQRQLQTHRGYDFGALSMARDLAAAFKAPLVASTVTRLLVDLNRSIGHPHLHSAAARHASREALERILADHYLPYRARAGNLVEQAFGRGQRVIHVSSHSFAPRLNGTARSADVGLLYDPGRPGEVRLCALWKAALEQAAPQLRVRRNYPYAGKNDGLTSHFRRRYPSAAYIGVEIEINQAHVAGTPRRWADLRAAIIESLRIALGYGRGGTPARARVRAAAAENHLAPGDPRRPH